MKDEKAIKNWFADHKAEYEKLNDDISILNWKKPGTNMYGIRYVFDKNKLYVSGDLGEAIFSLTWKATLKSFENINLRYFHSKLLAYGDLKYSFDSHEAEMRLQEEIDEMAGTEIDNEYFEILEKLKKVADGCSSNKEWEARIAYDGYSPLFDQLQKYDTGCWEWIFEIGHEIPMKIKAYLIGLEMANKKLQS